MITLVASHELKIKVSKYNFAEECVHLLGYIVDQRRVQVYLVKVDFIRKTPRLVDQTELRSVFLFAGYYRRIIYEPVDISASLHAATSSRKGFL